MIKFNTSDEIISYAFVNHISYNFLTMQEFVEDYKLFKNIKRHIKKHGTHNDKKYLLLNYLITAKNIFTVDVVKNILYNMLIDYNLELLYIFNYLDDIY